MKIQINKAPPVVQPPDTFILTGTLEELSAIKTFADYYAAATAAATSACRSRAALASRAARRLVDNIHVVGCYAWSDASKLFLKDE